MKTFGVLCLGLVFIGTANLASGDDGQPRKEAPKESPHRIVHKELIRVCIEALKDKDEDETVRSNAAQALVNLGRDAVPSVVELLTGKDNDLRIKAATILANMRPAQAPEAIPILVAALKNKKEDKDFRRQASFALSQMLAPVVPNR